MSEKDLATGNGGGADSNRAVRQKCGVADAELAARIHYSMIPDGFQNDFFDIDVKLIPCQKVGGDYCSIIPRGEKQLNVNICDVMGHGTASALLAARINSYILTWTMHMNHPCEIIDSLNDFLFENFSQYNIFSTFFSLFLDMQTGILQYAGSGHPPAIYYNHAAGETSQLKSGTEFLGLFKPLKNTCDIRRVSLSPGDRIVLYTDGVTDVENLKKEYFGVEGIERMVREHPGLNPGEWNNRLEQELFTTFEGTPTDDILILTIKIR